MATTLPDILQGVNLLGHVQQVVAGLPTQYLPPEALRTGRTVEGNSFTYTLESGTQAVPPISAYGAVARSVTPSSLSVRSGVTITSSLERQFKAHDLMNLMSVDQQRQRLGEAEVTRVVNWSTIQRQNLRTAAICSAFMLDNIYFDGNGNLLHSSSGAVQTIAMPTATTLTPSASWATATTDILTDIQGFQATSVQTTGRPLTTALYDPAVLANLMGNTDARDLIIRNNAANNAILNGSPAGATFDLMGIRWYPAQMNFFRDSGGTAREWTTANSVTFLPDFNTDWYELVEGTTPVADGASAGAGSVESIMSGIGITPGMWQYAVPASNPVGANYYFGDNFLPVIKVVGAVCRCATTTP